MKPLTLDEQIETLEGHNVWNQKQKDKVTLATKRRLDEMIDQNSQIIDSLKELKGIREGGIKNES